MRHPYSTQVYIEEEGFVTYYSAEHMAFVKTTTWWRGWLIGWVGGVCAMLVLFAAGRAFGADLPIPRRPSVAVAAPAPVKRPAPKHRVATPLPSSRPGGLL